MNKYNKEYEARNKVPESKITTRPLAGNVLLKLFKDRYSLAPLCDVLRVEYKTDLHGYPLKSTFDGIIEALIHQIRSRDVSMQTVIEQLRREMINSKYPVTTREKWEEFKLFEGDETYL